MATDLFNNYYNNPQRQVIYTNMSCPGASSENQLIFSINDGSGDISNSKDVLTSIDLSKISSPLSEWENSSKIIPANSILYVPGKSYGESYKRIVYGKIDNDLLNIETQNEMTINFLISYLKNNNFPCSEVISVNGYSFDEIIENINNKFNELKANVECELISYPDSDIMNLLSFKSNKLGYDFYINNISYYVTCSDFGCDDECDDYIEFPLEESLALYVPAKKYRNGAHKGILIIPTYPKYNNDNISSEEKSLAIAHLNDRVNLYLKHDNELYEKHTFDVFGDLSLINEYDNCVIFHDKFYSDELDLSDMWLNDDQDEFTVISNGMKMVTKKIMGLYGYCNYATMNGLWTRFGDMYCVIAANDVDDSNIHNYINSFVVYNPNNYDMKVNIMTWN